MYRNWLWISWYFIQWIPGGKEDNPVISNFLQMLWWYHFWWYLKLDNMFRYWSLVPSPPLMSGSMCSAQHWEWEGEWSCTGDEAETWIKHHSWLQTPVWTADIIISYYDDQEGVSYWGIQWKYYSCRDWNSLFEWTMVTNTSLCSGLVFFWNLHHKRCWCKWMQVRDF